jgi:transposase
VNRYTPAELAAFLDEVRASNLSARSKTMASQLAADSTALEAKLQDAQAQLASIREQRLNETVNEPSSKKPEWNKDNSPEPEKRPPPKGKRKPGGRRPRSGNRSKANLQPDRSVFNPLSQCPACASNLADQPPVETKTRIVEDIEPPTEKTVVTQETSVRKWCPSCRKIVSAKSELALPRCDIGLHAAVRMVYLWVVTALSLPNIQKYLSGFMRLSISTSGISKLMIRIAAILVPVADEIHQDIKDGFTVWADETGWRVRGVTWWLWAFANETSAYYYAAASRGSPVVTLILGEVFAGVLITDAWAAYNVVECLVRQTCMAHIFRKVRRVVQDNPNARSILRFYVRLKRILRDGERLRQLADAGFLDQPALFRAHERLETRLDQLLAWKNPNPLLAKIIASIRRQQLRILTFVLIPGCPSHNNYGEYIIRKGVLKRKISGGSMSAKGAQAYAILISIAQTCHLRKISFSEFLLVSLRHYCRTGKPLLLSEYTALRDKQDKAEAAA